MIFLRQSTASQEIPLGRFVDSTDGNTEKVALSIANTDIKIWKTGATTLASKNSGGATHIANGEYYCVLDATDTDTIGPLKVTVHVAGALYVQVFCTVLDEAVYDVLFGTTALATATNITAAAGCAVSSIGANVITASAIAADAITAAKIADGAIDAATFAAGAINAAAIASDAITDAKVASDVTIASVTGAVGSVTGAVGSVTGSVGSVTATVSADVISISGDSTAADNAESYFDGTGYGDLLQRTTIATLASQISFTLTAGSADNDAYNDCAIVIQDASTAAQKAVAVVDDYTGSTKTITLRTDPAVFTMATTDIVTIYACRALKPTVMNRTLDVSTGGEAGLDWANVGSPTTTVGLSGTTVKTATDVETDTQDIQSRLPAALSSGNMKCDVLALSGDTTAADNAEAFFDGTGYAGTNNVIPTVTALTNLPSITAGWLTAAGIASDAFTAAKFAADCITAAKIADGAIDTATFASGTTIPRCTLVDTLTTYTGNTVQTGDAYAIVNSGTHGNAAIKGYVDDIGTAGAGLTAVPWNAAWDTEVQSEVQDAIEANHLDHLIAVADPGSIVANSSLWAALTSKSATPAYSSYVNTTDSLEALRDRGDSAWATATGFSTHSAADVWAVATRVLTAGTNIQLPSNGLANVTAWTVAITGNVTGNLSGSVGSVTGSTAQTGDSYSLLTSAVADSVPADGTRPSPVQALYMMVQGLFEGSISGTTWTIKKVDGSTTLFTVTLDSSSAPTSKTRSG